MAKHRKAFIKSVSCVYPQEKSFFTLSTQGVVSLLAVTFLMSATVCWSIYGEVVVPVKKPCGQNEVANTTLSSTTNEENFPTCPATTFEKKSPLFNAFPNLK